MHRSLLRAVLLLVVVAVAATMLGGSPKVARAQVKVLTNTAVSEAQISALTAAVPTLTAYTGAAPPVVLDAQGDPGAVQSAAYDLGGGLFLYAYQLECHTGPNWDITALVVPHQGNNPVPMDLDGVGPLDDSFSVTSPTGFQPYTQDLANFNADDIFGVDVGDFPTGATFDGTSVTFAIPDVFLSSNVFGFVKDSPPIIVNGTFATGSATSFDMVVPNTFPKVGGLSVDLDEGLSALPLEATKSSGNDTGLLAGLIAAIAISAVTLTGAAWYARRRWLQ